MATSPVPVIVVLPGSVHFNIPGLRDEAAVFGFGLEVFDDLHEALALRDPLPVAAVMFHRDAFGPRCSWFDAIRLLRDALPGARLIPCHGFSEEVHWDAIAEHGAWHSLWLPLKDSELRQCLGFLWDALHPAGPDLAMEQPAASRPDLRFPPVCVCSLEPSPHLACLHAA